MEVNIFGLIGSHRAGKTTLAKALAATCGYTYFDGSFGRLARELKFDAVADMTVAQRIEMQERVLAYYVDLIAVPARPAITDRTPIDMLAYATAEVGMHADLSPELAARIVAYQNACLRATAMHFGALCACRPLPVYKLEEGKPPPCPAYQQHIQLVMEGAMDRVKDSVHLAYLTTSDHGTRLACASQFFGDILEATAAALAGEHLH